MAFVERERKVNAKVKGEGADPEDTVLFAGQSALGHPGWQKAGMGEKKRSRGPVSLRWNQNEVCLSQKHKSYWE